MMKITVSPVYTQARQAQHVMIDTMNTVRGGLVASDVWEFEDEMNGLSGEILNLEPSLQLEIQNTNAEIVSRGNSAGIIVSLYPSLLPPKKGKEQDSYLQQAKKLYPLTTSVVITANLTTSNTITTVSNVDTLNVTTTSNVVYDANVISSLTSDEEEIDSIFAENDLDVVEEFPLAELQNETAPYISNAMIELAITAAANVGGLEDGLATYTHNPLAALIDGSVTTIYYYTQNNFANLNTALSGVSADGALTNEYKTFRTAVGGIDGNDGCVTQLELFKDHTNRLSGLLLDSTSPNASNTNESMTEFFYVNDFSGGPSVIFSFNARHFRTGHYLIQSTGNATDRAHQVNDLIVLHDSITTNTISTRLVNTMASFVTFSSQLANSNVEILATTTVPNTYFVVHGTRLSAAKQSVAHTDISQQKIIQQHESLQAILDDGIDYVALQSASLVRGDLVANLARLFRDALATFSSGSFLAQSTGTKQAALISASTNMKLHCANIQAQIDSDYNKFVELRKLIEALDIGYDLTVINTDLSSNTSATLNSVTSNAINSEQ
jgi:hypothetical protein